MKRFWPNLVHWRPLWGVLVVAGAAANVLAQTSPTLPLGLDQRVFLYRTNLTFSPVTGPMLNWQSKRGVPISTSALDAGSDGRAPTTAQQISYGTNYPTAAPTPGQFRGWVGIAALAVQQTTNLNSNRNFAQNAVALNWPRLESSPGQVVAVLRASQAAVPYIALQSSFPFGSVISPPLTDEHGTQLTNNPVYWLSAPFASSTNSPYYYSSSANVVFATQPGQVSIVWEKAVPSSFQPTNLPALVGAVQQGNNWYILFTNTYLVSGQPIKTPQKMYWTEGNQLGRGQPVNIPDGVDLNIVFNTGFPATVASGDSSPNANPYYTNRTLFVSVGPPKQLRADNATGRAFVEMVGVKGADGVVPFLGFEIVDVYSQPVPTDISVELGTRVPGYADGRDDSQLSVVPISGTTAFYYQQSLGNNSVNLYAIQETHNVDDFKAYWLNTGVAGLRWPYLFNRYREYWSSYPSHYVFYLRPLVATDAQATQTAVQLPSTEAPSRTPLTEASSSIPLP